MINFKQFLEARGEEKQLRKLGLSKNMMQVKPPKIPKAQKRANKKFTQDYLDDSFDNHL